MFVYSAEFPTAVFLSPVVVSPSAEVPTAVLRIEVVAEVKAPEPTAILCVPVVHAVTIDKFGPLNPYLIDKLPEIILIIDAGTKKGEILLDPLLLNISLVFSIFGKPPIPDPIATPIRFLSISSSRIFES